MKFKETLILVHASDFHIAEGDDDILSDENDIRTLFAFDVEQLAKELGRPNAVILSGDIAKKGSQKEYDVAHKVFGKLLDRLGMKPHRIMAVPGNHDVNRFKTVDLKSRMIRDRIRSKSERDADNEFREHRNHLLKAMEEFQQFAASYDCIIEVEKGYWEFLSSTEGGNEYLGTNLNCMIRGISTSHISDSNDNLKKYENLSADIDYGWRQYVAKGQLNQLPCVHDSPFRILVGHHPPKWWRFEESRRNLIDDRYHLQLYGHEHEFSPAVSSNSVCLKSGAINPDEEGKSFQPRYNWIQINKVDQGFNVRIWSRVFSAQHKFIEDPDWLAGQGYFVSNDLKMAPKIIDPEVKQELNCMGPSEDFKVNEVEMADVIDEQPTLADIRYALFSQHPEVYAYVFRDMGIVPNEKQEAILGGIEFYRDQLKGIFDSRLKELLEAMKTRGINVI